MVTLCRNKRRHNSETSDVEEYDNFYNETIDFNDSSLSDERGIGDEDPLALGNDLDSDFDEDPLGSDAENCVTDFDGLTARDDEYNFDESDFEDGSDNEFSSSDDECESESESDDDSNTERNEAPKPKGKPCKLTKLIVVLLISLNKT